MLSAWLVVVAPLGRDVLDTDLTLAYTAVRIGLEHGWSQVYSLSLQHEYFARLRPNAAFTDGERFVSPPPLAWLVLPFSALGAAGALYAWLAFSAACLAIAWWIAAPGQGVLRGLWLLFALAWYPVLYGLGLGQPDLVLVLAVAASWRLAEGGRQYLAGAVLAFALLKPQLFLLVPVVLLAAGRWRVVAGWAAVAAVLAAASLAAIGSQGANDYRALLDEAQRVVNNRYFTLAFVLGPGNVSYFAQGAVAVIAAAGGFLNRRSSLAKLYALGIVATALGATYWHLQDYTVLVLAAWLYWRTSAAAWQRWWLAVVVAGGELAWPLHPLPILVGVAVWLAFLLVPESRAERIAAPARAA